MNPFYFGSSDAALYGVYNPPRGRPRPEGVVLCYPFGMEYMRAHRAFRQLTNLLTRSGLHVLRFDYYGTGDSAGEGAEGSLPLWVENIGTAVEELKDTAGVTRVSLVGLRLGGLLAARAAMAGEPLDRVVLWDPVVDGAAYVREMVASGDPVPAGAGTGLPSGSVGVSGFPLTPRLQEEIGAEDLTKLSGFRAERLLLTVSSEEAPYLALRDAWRRDGVPGEYHHIPSAGNWAEGDKFGSALIPQAIIQGVVDCFN